MIGKLNVVKFHKVALAKPWARAGRRAIFQHHYRHAYKLQQVRFEITICLRTFKSVKQVSGSSLSVMEKFKCHSYLLNFKYNFSNKRIACLFKYDKKYRLSL